MLTNLSIPSNSLKEELAIVLANVTTNSTTPIRTITPPVITGHTGFPFFFYAFNENNVLGNNI